MVNVVFLRAGKTPEQGYAREDAQKLNGLSFPSYEAFHRHYPDEENPNGDNKIIRYTEDDFAELWNKSYFDRDLIDDYYTAIVNIG